MPCPKCGADCAPEAAFCSACGASLRDRPPSGSTAVSDDATGTHATRPGPGDDDSTQPMAAVPHDVDMTRLGPALTPDADMTRLGPAITPDEDVTGAMPAAVRTSDSGRRITFEGRFTPRPGVTPRPGITPRPAGGPPSASGPLGVGEAFGDRYHIIRLLGMGGMGAVYHAWDSELEVALALKVIRPDASQDAEVVAETERRFKRELLDRKSV